MELFKKLSKEGILKNKEIYFPYILIFALFVAIFNINLLLFFNTNLDKYYGMESVKAVLKIASYIIGIFSLLFLYYADGFLLNRRLKEVSVYAILGIDKKKIILIMVLESLWISIAATLIGYIISTIFYKIFEALFYNMMKIKVNFSLNMDIRAYIITLILFIFISFLIIISRIIKIKRKTILELFKKEKTFKKVKYLKLKAVMSILFLGVGYLVAITIKSPLKALNLFFVDVLIVILGTFFLFEALSIFILEKLKKSKSYYKKNNFMAISGLIFRLKSSAKGLSNICIMSCGAIVLIASAFSLYLGIKDNINMTFPREVTIKTNDINKINLSDEIIRENNLKKLRDIKYKNFTLAAIKDGDKLIEAGKESDFSKVILINVIEKKDIEDLKNKELKDGEVFIYTDNNKLNKINSFKIKDKIFNVKHLKDINFIDKSPEDVLVSTAIVVTNNLSEIAKEKEIYINEYFDLSDSDRKIYFKKGFNNKLPYDIKIKTESYKYAKGFYGAIFFVGIFLGSVFILGTLFIIYYKNLQEGYADREKYKILREVGMTESEIKKAINTQVKIFFLLPVIVSGIHMCFAFPIVSKLFILGGFLDLKIKIISFVAIYIVFLIFYLLYYKLTSKVYYKIIKK